jgi:hypothetical protein
MFFETVEDFLSRLTVTWENKVYLLNLFRIINLFLKRSIKRLAFPTAGEHAQGKLVRVIT